MPGHFRDECKHGWVQSSCRCPGPHQIKLVPCPDPGSASHIRHQTFVDKLVATKEATAAAQSDPVPEALREAFRSAMDREQVAKSIYAAPYSSHDDLVAFHVARGQVQGLGIAMEILEKFNG